MAKRGGFPGGMPGNMNNLMKQAQKMQKQMEENQKALEEKEQIPYRKDRMQGEIEEIMEQKGNRNPAFGPNHAIWFLFCRKHRKFVVGK